MEKMSDPDSAKRIHDMMRAAFEVAFDAVLDAGWHFERMRIAHDISRGTCMQLQVNVETPPRESWCTVFVVMLTFDIALPLHAREVPSVVSIVEQWHPIPTAPAFDPDAVDRIALARMFPDWETPRSLRGRATRGVINPKREADA